MKFRTAQCGTACWVVVCLGRGIEDGSWPPGIDIQLLIPNNPMLLWLRVMVVNIREKPKIIWHVGAMKMNANESLKKHR